MSDDKASKWLAPGIALAGILVSAAIGYTGYENSRMQQRANAFSNFYSRTGSEEAFWKALYDDYLASFDERFEQHPEWRRARLVAIFEMARSREIPAFEEFAVPDERRRQWKARLTELQTSLYNGLEEQAAADSELRQELVRRGFGRDSAPSDDRPQNPAVNAVPAAAPPARPVITTEISTAAGVDSTLRAPAADASRTYSDRTASGWDLDIFWCRGNLQDENYRRADMLAREFAKLADEGRAIASGVILGRVRTRPASVAYQRQSGSAAARSWVIADSAPGEAEAAAAVRESANVLLGSEIIGLGTSVGTPTRWYLSMFLCGGGRQAPNA